MKKILSFIIIALFSVFFLTAALPAAAYSIPCEIVITECFSNPNTVPYEGGANTKDFVEYMEIMNISAHDVDLYDYTFYYLTDTTADAVQAKADTGAAGKSETFSDIQGQYVLKPGQTALVWFITSEVWQYQSTHLMMALGTDNKPEYYTDKYWQTLHDFAVNTCQMTGIPDTLNGIIVVYDLSNEYGTGDTHFNMANPSATKACGYYICARDAAVESYFTGVIVPATADSADVGFSYDLSDGKVLSLVDSTIYDVTPGALHPSQKNLAAVLGVTFETAAQETTTGTPSTTANPGTTSPSVTTNAATTTKAATTAPATTAPMTTSPSGRKGCGSALNIMPLLFVLAASLVITKKKN